MAEITLIDFLRAELNSFSGEEISIKDCNRITIRLWNMSNSNFQLCSEAINNLKSKNEKIEFFKNQSLSYLSKLSEKLGPSDFVYKIKTNNTKQKKYFKYGILINFIFNILIPFILIVILLWIFLPPFN